MARLGTLKPLLKAAEHRTCPPPAKQADAELQTAEHRAWRKAVLDRAGYRCEDCGKQGGRGHAITLYADHILERRDGGAALDPKNGRCLCGSCHGKKTAAERARRIHDWHGLGPSDTENP